MSEPHRRSLIWPGSIAGIIPSSRQLRSYPGGQIARSRQSESVLGRRGDGPSIVQTASDIEEAEKNAIGTNADEITEIACHTETIISRGKFGSVNFEDTSEWTGSRTATDRDSARTEERAHGKSSRDVSTEFEQKTNKKRNSAWLPLIGG